MQNSGHHYKCVCKLQRSSHENGRNIQILDLNIADSVLTKKLRNATVKNKKVNKTVYILPMCVCFSHLLASTPLT